MIYFTDNDPDFVKKKNCWHKCANLTSKKINKFTFGVVLSGDISAQCSTYRLSVSNSNNFHSASLFEPEMAFIAKESNGVTGTITFLVFAKCLGSGSEKKHKHKS